MDALSVIFLAALNSSSSGTLNSSSSGLTLGSRKIAGPLIAALDPRVKPEEDEVRTPEEDELRAREEGEKGAPEEDEKKPASIHINAFLVIPAKAGIQSVMFNVE